MTPGDIYLAELPLHVGAKRWRNSWWRVEILSRPHDKNVDFRWLAGPLAGKQGRREAKTLRKI